MTTAGAGMDSIDSPTPVRSWLTVSDRLEACPELEPWEMLLRARLRIAGTNGSVNEARVKANVDRKKPILWGRTKPHNLRAVDRLDMLARSAKIVP